LIGAGGPDTLNGGTGDDTMIGGAGDESYFVDSANDRVVEAETAGTDTVNTTISYTLGANVENLVANSAVTAGLVLNGNSLVNNITGGNGNDVLFGGNDSAGAAADVLTGGQGNDTYIIREGADDTIVELENNAVAGTTGGTDTVLVVASATRTAYTLGGAAAVEILQASDASSTLGLNLTGNTFTQTIVGNNGNNAISSGGGTADADTLIGLGGDDTYTVSNGSVVVTEVAGGGIDSVTITGLGVAAGSATSTTAANVRAREYTFSGDIESISAAGSTGAATNVLNITGGSISQTIVGSNSANRLNGNGGTDTLSGLDGNDTYVVDSFDDVVIERTAAGVATTGTDTVIASSSYALSLDATVASNIEVLAAAGLDLTVTQGQGNGTFDLNAVNTRSTTNFFVGDNLTSQRIWGDAGANTLNGRLTDAANGAGITDTLIGLGGSDTYRVYDANDVVVEDSSGGTADFIYTSASFNLAANDTRVGALVINNGTNNVRLDGVAVATADGGTGAATTPYITGPGQIEVLSAADQAAGTTGTDGIDLTGNAYGQIIVGNFDDNVIDDGGSLVGTTRFQDQLAGLGGNDLYIVRAQNTTVNEGTGAGTDTVDVRIQDAAGALISGGFFGLIDRSEVEFVTAVNMGANSVGLSGNEFNQVLTGSAGDNTFDGRGGQDTLIGGAGNDTYFITSAQAAGNTTIIEAAGTGGGTADAVSTSVTFDLAQNNATVVATAGGSAATIGGIIGIEQIYVTNGQSTDNINLTGNGAAQFIVGNFGNNVLDGDNDTRAGGAGTALTGTVAGDTMAGLFGNDTYRVYSQADVVLENANEGTDTVFTSSNYQLRTGTSIEVLAAADATSTTGLLLVGNELNQTIGGTRGADTIWGGSGNDTLLGDGGNDIFGFAQSGPSNVDTLGDFAPGDLIGLYTGATSTFATQSFSGLLGGSTTGLDQNEFVLGTTAVGNNAQIIYNQTTGQLFYDADGATAGGVAAVQFAQLNPGTGLGFNDFTFLSTAPTVIPAPAAPVA